LIVGLDTNILCYALDPAYSEHLKVREILLKLSPDNRVAINPTVLHETYHTLVFGQKWVPLEARRRLQMLLRHPYIEFLNQTKRTCIISLNLAEKYGLGGRDALIIANFISNKISKMYTHESEILSLSTIRWRKWILKFIDPIEK